MTENSSPESNNPLQRLSSLLREYPNQFWVLVLGTFVDRLGAALLFPFFSLYLTRKFGIGMTQVGVIFGVFAISSFVGSMVGGALTDRLGRKSILLFGLVMSALSSLLMGVIDSLVLFFFVTLIVGVLSEAGGPAQQALVADLLPEEQRAQGYGILRVVINLSVTIGPVIGGLLASTSYLLLFVSDAGSSLVTAGIVYFALKETWQPGEKAESAPSVAGTFRGYLEVARDSALVWFLGASILMVLVYMQMNTTLAVYLRDVHSVSERGFGYILSLNAAMVVVFQFAVTRWITRYRPLVVMAAGSLLYAIGFALYGFVSWYGFFLAAMAIITVGEMMVSPVSQSIVARLAPEDMRGRYMAVYGFSWLIPIAVGPLLAGLVMDNANPDWVWYLAGIIGIAAAGAFYLLGRRIDRAQYEVVEGRLKIIERLERGEINAEEAGRLLQGVTAGLWARFSAPAKAGETPHLRVQVTDQLTGTIKSDLRIPVGLVGAVLYGQGGLTDYMDQYGTEDLKQMIAGSADDHSPRQADRGDDHIEVSFDDEEKD